MRAALGLSLVVLASACISVVSLEDAGIATDRDTRASGWMRIRSLRFGSSLALPGTPEVREQIDDPRNRREGVVLSLPTDALAHEGYEVRLFRYTLDEDAERRLEQWGEESFARIGGQLEGEERLEIGGRPGLVARYANVGASSDHVWLVAASDGRSVVEVIARNLFVPSDGTTALTVPADLAPIVEAIAFGR